MAMDLVCNMEVDEATAQWTTEYKGQTYYFCAPGCKKSFDDDPEKYVGGSGSHESHEGHMDHDGHEAHEGHMDHEDHEAHMDHDHEGLEAAHEAHMDHDHSDH